LVQRLVKNWRAAQLLKSGHFGKGWGECQGKVVGIDTKTYEPSERSVKEGREKGRGGRNT